MPAEFANQEPATQPDWALVTSGRLADGGPRYTETPAELYRPDAPLIAEPWNAVTASFFIVIVGFWVWRLCGRYRDYPFLCCCLPILLAGGVGGTLYHALRTSWAYFYLDIVPIMLLAVAGAVYIAIRLSRRRWWIYVLTSVSLYFGVHLILFDYIPRENIHWAINLSYACLALLVLTPIAVLLVRTRFRHGGWVVAGLVSFTIAWFFRLVDHQIGIYLPMGSHWLWHTFGAISTTFIIEFFYLVEGERKAAPADSGLSGTTRGHRTALTYPEVIMLSLSKYSIGVGDRFGKQAKAQLRACMDMAEQGIDVIPVWNKSNREHLIIGSEPASIRAAANAAVKELGWTEPYHVDADHIRLDTVDRFLAASDFFTIDVADSIGQPADPSAIVTFTARHAQLIGDLEIPGIEHSLSIAPATLEQVAAKYLKAAQDAGAIYRKIAAAKGEGSFVTEVSMDETDSPQTPPELLLILAMLADEKVPLQTIAPKFTGRFNKGVDYDGDVKQFEKEFRSDLAVIAFAVERFGLPANLKLSIHSGSDKFSIYEPMRKAIRDFDAGLHLKTAGTTWLEEVIGLAESGGDGLDIAKDIYAKALAKKDELCGPYATVIDIDASRLPSAAEVNGWTSQQFVGALRHDPSNPAFNPHLRQLVHVGFKVAAQMGDRYLRILDACEPAISRNVTGNLLDRHLKPLFGQPKQ